MAAYFSILRALDHLQKTDPIAQSETQMHRRPPLAIGGGPPGQMISWPGWRDSSRYVGATSAQHPLCAVMRRWSGAAPRRHDPQMPRPCPWAAAARRPQSTPCVEYLRNPWDSRSVCKQASAGNHKYPYRFLRCLSEHWIIERKSWTASSMFHQLERTDFPQPWIFLQIDPDRNFCWFLNRIHQNLQKSGHLGVLNFQPNARMRLDFDNQQNQALRCLTLPGASRRFSKRLEQIDREKNEKDILDMQSRKIAEFGSTRSAITKVDSNIFSKALAAGRRRTGRKLGVRLREDGSPSRAFNFNPSASESVSELPHSANDSVRSKSSQSAETPRRRPGHGCKLHWVNLLQMMAAARSSGSQTGCRASHA